MLAFRFCSFSSRFFSWLGSSSLVFVPLLLVLSGVAPLWFAAFVVVRRFCFVRFVCPSAASLGLSGRRGRRLCRSPRFGFVRPSAAWGLRVPFPAARWACVPASGLSSLRASSFVWAVRPAVVSRRSGVVLVWWVFLSPPASYGGKFKIDISEKGKAACVLSHASPQEESEVFIVYELKIKLDDNALDKLIELQVDNCRTAMTLEKYAACLLNYQINEFYVHLQLRKKS